MVTIRSRSWSLFGCVGSHADGPQPCAALPGAVDAAGVNARKVHKRTVPRMGGVAIAGAFFAPLVGLLFVESGVGGQFTERGHLVAGLLLGGLAILALGVYDDVVGARARHKLAVQLAWP